MTAASALPSLARRALLAAAFAAAAAGIAATTAGAQSLMNPWAAPSSVKSVGKYADVNGIRLYYEVHGQGQPLVLLHGGLGAGSMFAPVLPAYTKGRQVILVDLQGHGRTADVDRPMSVEAMGDDIAALIAHLGIRRADVMGYSLGGGVALQTAARHPGVVRRLVIVSTAIRSKAIHPAIRAQQVALNGSMAGGMKETPMSVLYRSVAPRPQDFPRLLDKIGDFMKADYDFTEQLAGIAAPTLIVAADADLFPPAHAVEAYGLRDRGKRDAGWNGAGRSQQAQLAILPGLTHYDIFTSPALAAVATSFLSAK